MATMTIRCDEADKKAAAEVAEFYGFDLSSVTRALWRQIARTYRIPLDLDSYGSNPESLRKESDGGSVSRKRTNITERSLADYL